MRGFRLSSLVILTILFSLGTVSFAIDQDNLPDNLNVPALDWEQDASAPNPIHVGDRILLKLKGLDARGVARATRDLKAAPPKSETPTPESSSSPQWITQAVSENQQIPDGEFRMLWVPIQAGDIQVPTFFISNTQGLTVVRANPERFHVESAISKSDPKPEEPNDLINPLKLRYPWWYVMILSLLALGVLSTLGVGIHKIYQKYRKNSQKMVELPKVIKTPEQKAMDALKELEAQGLLTRGLVKKYYFGVSEILKEYLGSRFKIDAQESTTGEMLKALKASNEVMIGVYERIETLFLEMDQVKFTDFIPTLDSSRTVISRAQEIVRVTPAPVAQVVGSPHA